MNFKKKIINFNQINKILSKVKNKNKIIHCHGVFDLVHPGHIRHLTFCKNKADILIVSITPDKFIKKGIYRPLVPENIRANNLAVLELVDYVVIDKFQNPYNLIKKIKPNFFAKGNEYISKSNPLTKKEENIVKRFGGKMIFTPGDFVLSSTKIINDYNINLKYDKIKNLIEASKYKLEDIIKIINNFKNIKVHVIGDLIVDKLVECEAVAGLHKTPTLSLLKKNTTSYIGGAGIVAAHFSSFTKNVSLTTIINNDANGKFAKKKLKEYNVKLNPILEKDRVTTEKKIYISKGHNLLKVNNVSNLPISEVSLYKIKKILRKNNYDIIVFADYRHGIFNKHSHEQIIKSANQKAFKVADSQVASRWGNILDFKKFDLITPTEQEARYSLFEQDLTIRALASKLIKKSKAKNLILKLGDKGLISVGAKKPEYITLDPFVNNLIDSNGAGDALLAYSSAALFKEKSLIIASIIGILAASCKCEKMGNLPIKLNEIKNKINQIQDFIN